MSPGHSEARQLLNLHRSLLAWGDLPTLSSEARIQKTSSARVSYQGDWVATPMFGRRCILLVLHNLIFPVSLRFPSHTIPSFPSPAADDAFVPQLWDLEHTGIYNSIPFPVLDGFSEAFSLHRRLKQATPCFWHCQLPCQPCPCHQLPGIFGLPGTILESSEKTAIIMLELYFSFLFWQPLTRI